MEASDPTTGQRKGQVQLQMTPCLGLLLRFYFTGSGVKITIIATLALRGLLTSSPFDKTLIRLLAPLASFPNSFVAPIKAFAPL